MIFLLISSAVDTNRSSMTRAGEGCVLIVTGLTVTAGALAVGTVGGDHGFVHRLRRDRRVGGTQGCDTALRPGKVAGTPTKGRGSGGALCIETRALVEEAGTNIVVMQRSKI